MLMDKALKGKRLCFKYILKGCQLLFSSQVLNYNDKIDYTLKESAVYIFRKL